MRRFDTVFLGPNLKSLSHKIAAGVSVRLVDIGPSLGQRAQGQEKREKALPRRQG